MNKESILAVLEVARNAPSGDNTQPWRFAVEDNSLEIYNDESKTNPIFDSKQYGAYIGHGCLIENIRQESCARGYKIHVQYFPQGSSNPVAKITFSEEECVSDIAKYIPERKTNRNPYKNQLLSEEERTCFEHKSLMLIDGDKKKDLTAFLSKAEKTVFETPELQDIIYSSLRWSKKEEQEKKEGLFVHTLELNPVQVGLLKLSRNRKILNFLNKIGFASLVSKSNKETYLASSALGFIVGERNPTSYVQAGELLENTWLKAQSIGMSMQIINGSVFMAQDIKHVVNETAISDENKTALSEGLAQAREILNLNNDQHILSAFRIGYAKKEASETSTKQEVVELLKEAK